MTLTEREEAMKYFVLEILKRSEEGVGNIHHPLAVVGGSSEAAVSRTANLVGLNSCLPADTKLHLVPVVLVRDANDAHGVVEDFLETHFEVSSST